MRPAVHPARPPPRPRLILHVGTHKTGTKSIQRAAAINREHLGRHGILYPDGRVPFGEIKSPHHRFSHCLTGTTPSGWLDAVAFADHLRGQAAGKTVLISAEPIYRHQNGKGKDDFSIAAETFWINRRIYLENLRRVLGAFTVEVLIYFRRRDELAESWYWNRLQKFGPQAPFAEFLTAFEPWFDYERHVALFREVFGQVRVEGYEMAKGAPDGLVGHFFRTVGAPPPEEAGAIWEHRGDYKGDAFGSAEARAAFLARYPPTIPT